jgi:hypothetical protein
MRPAAQADQCASGPGDIPQPVQQAPPAAQRPGVATGAMACSTQRAQPRLQAVERPLGVGQPVLGRRSPTDACQCSRGLAMPRTSKGSGGLPPQPDGRGGSG